MKKSFILKKIPYDQEFNYTEIKESYMDELNENKRHGASIIGCVNWLMENNAYTMDENGMDKFVIMITSLLFLIDHNEISIDLSYDTKWDILDFETENYDDLFTPDDLELIKGDIKIINDYFEKHPELIKGVESDRKKAQEK